MDSEALDNPEIIINLWYVFDDLGMIYSLRARAYVGTGTDQQKLEMLQRLATIDYLIAQPFSIPERFHTVVTQGGKETKLAVAPMRVVKLLGGPEILFADVYGELEKQLPTQTKLSVGQRPLVCVTPLFGDGKGNIYPKFLGPLSI